MPDNAICNFCGSYDHKPHYCLTKQTTIFHHPLKPVNCRRYNGPFFTVEKLEEYRKMAKLAERKI